MVIDCDTCVARGPACTDCVITHLLGPDTRELPGEEVAALAVLAGSGLVPPLRLLPRTQPPPAAIPRTSDPDGGEVLRPAAGA